MATVLEIAKLLGYALLTSVVFVFFRNVLPRINSHRTTGWAVLRAEGYSLMFVGAFVTALGFLLTRLNT